MIVTLLNTLGDCACYTVPEESPSPLKVAIITDTDRQTVRLCLIFYHAGLTLRRTHIVTSLTIMLFIKQVQTSENLQE